MAQLKITKVRSTIKRPSKQKLTMEALGLRKMNDTAVVEDNAQMQGMIAVVRHLVKVEAV